MTCRAYRPQTKGKVEALARTMERLRPYDYEFDTIEELAEIVKEVNWELNQEISKATWKVPADLLKKEKEYFRPLPSKDVIETYLTTPIRRKVSKESMVAYKNQKYSSSDLRSMTSVSTSYNTSSAAAYADSYAINNNSLFAPLSSDCANFVSQCVWAGFIGWNSSMSSSTVQSYIANDYKMVIGQSSLNWYMGPNTGHSNWISISNFASYITHASKTYGPNGSIFNNNKLYSDLPTILIVPGKAIQMGTSTSSYSHSAFIYSSTGNTLSNKLCAAHTSNQKTTVAAFAAVYPYIRLLSFTTSDFAS